MIRYVHRPLLILVLTLMGLCCSHTSGAQGISVTTSNTTSICFNDGTLTVTASGGTGPYTYTITAGPVDPNITYPVTLPAGNNTFVNLPHSTYTIQVTDAVGATGTFTGSVAGTYQFPTLTLTNVSNNEIIATASQGLPPYQFALSSTGANAGFGAYQVSDDFTGLCPGSYWVRVRDSCQNIYTAQITLTGYIITDSALCVNYSKGFFTMQASGGRAPYTYTFNGVSNTTGVFTGVQPYFAGLVTVIDACGVDTTTLLAQHPIFMFEDCPLDGKINLNNYDPSFFGPLTFWCTDCSPVQSVSGVNLPAHQIDSVFYNTVPTQTYHIFALSPFCGGDTFYPIVSPPQPNLFTINSVPLSCNTVQVASNGTIDSVVLRDATGTIIAVSRTGLFYHLPDGFYIATAYTDSSTNICYTGDSSSTAISIPYFPGYCQQIVMDSGCVLDFEIGLVTAYPVRDAYSIIYAPHDTVPGDDQSVSGGVHMNPYFYHLASSGTYTILSDSGCSESIALDALPQFNMQAASSLPCVGGQPELALGNFVNHISDLCYFSLRYDIILNDTLAPYIINPNNGHLVMSDTGWYHVRWYISSYNAHGVYFHTDSTCPVDTAMVYVTNSPIPYPSPNFAILCDTSGGDTAYFHIYGGSTPYTVEIPGYDTITLQTNTGVFPSTHTGRYNMIVYDDCGISRSITFSIIDTCSGCPLAGIDTQDTLFCLGDPVPLTDASYGAVSYQWLINGVPFCSNPDTIFTPTTAGTYLLQLRVYGSSGCTDSTYAYAYVADPSGIYLGADTTYCDTFIRVLNTGIPTTAISSTVWSTGAIGPQITVNTPGMYWAQVTDWCTFSIDTIYIYSDAITGFQLTADKHSVCTDHADTVVLSASVSQTAVAFDWSTGQVDSPALSSTVSVYTPGIYQVTVHNALCNRTLSDTIAPRLCDSSSCPTAIIAAIDTGYCAGDTIRLHSISTGAVSYQWVINGNLYSISADTIFIAGTGSYSAILNVLNATGCGDSAQVHFNAVSPYIISLGMDTTYCDSFSRVLSTGIASTLWSTGAVGPQITVTAPGQYTAMVTNVCGSSVDTIIITLCDTIDSCVQKIAIPDIFSPNGDGKNEVFRILHLCPVDNFSMHVYSRWGELIFTSTDIDKGWDGTYRGKPQPEDVYTWFISLSGKDLNMRRMGTVTLVR